jgi:L-asparaginase II
MIERIAPAGQQAIAGHVPLAIVTRGAAVESVHYGSVAVANAQGELLASAGDAMAPIFTRSCGKPLQALPLVAHPRFATLGLTEREIAIVCASHSGEPPHVEAVQNILDRIGCDVRHLQCGVHPPLYLEATGKRAPARAVYTPLHHNCSGKHAGMLALARLLGAPPERYLEPEHPVQAAIRIAIGEAAGLPADRLVAGIDGCSAPNYALPLANLARAYAWLVNPPAQDRHAPAARAVAAAMSAYPELVSGRKRLDLQLAQAGNGEWVAKGGAEAVQCLALMRAGTGIAIKIADGNRRALAVVVTELLRQLGALDGGMSRALAKTAGSVITSNRGIQVGEIRPVFTLGR